MVQTSNVEIEMIEAVHRMVKRLSERTKGEATETPIIEDGDGEETVL